MRSKDARNNFFDEKVLEITDIIMKKLVKNKSIHFSDFEEVRQSVLEKYFSKKEQIIDAFEGKSKPDTYISAVIFRTALSVMRSRRNYAKYQSDVLPEESPAIIKEKTITPEEFLIIEDEKAYLKKVLLTLPDRHKATVFLKCYFRLRIEETDLDIYPGKTTDSNVHKVLNQTDSLNDKEVYALLCQIENQCSKKSVKLDAVRMYINKITAMVLARMNGRTKRAFYDKESLEILFEKLFSESESEIPVSLN